MKTEGKYQEDTEGTWAGVSVDALAEILLKMYSRGWRIMEDVKVREEYL